ncbi:MAG: cyanophycinase [Oscillatoriales cyanobacterium RM2_1_1]|nr:cyanophycinase [Oscillatoriales cyanobacterium SM2_3_0]NJO46881.1 cyanophycinase [Oscillatoriales cyanobacterium RM2_1_1]
MFYRFPGFAVVLVCLTLISCSLSTPAWARTLVLVGGGWQWPTTGDRDGIAIYQKVVQLAGGAETAKIGIFTTAQTSVKNAEASGEFYLKNFRDLYPNIDVKWIPFHLGNCQAKKNNLELTSLMKTRNAFVFSGGDQALIISCFFEENTTTQTRTESQIFQTLKQQYEQGSVVVGTSAGTTAQTGIPMITEGESYEALLKSPLPFLGSPPRTRIPYYNPLGGFNFFSYGILDTHFSQRGRQGRLIRLAADLSVPLAFGIDQNTALIVIDSTESQASLEVIGEHGVSVLNLRAATVSTTERYWSISEVLMSYLTAGDQYNLQTQTVIFASDKRPITCQKQYLISEVSDIFSTFESDDLGTENSGQFITLATDLFRSCETIVTGSTSTTNPIVFEVELQKNYRINPLGYQSVNQTGKQNYSFTNLEVSIIPRSEPWLLQMYQDYFAR